MDKYTLQVAGFNPYREADGYTFDTKKADDVISFFEHDLVHIEGRLQFKPFLLEPWQKALLANVFGWVDDKGFRRFKEVLLYIPRKNGKTTLVAGLIIYTFFHDNENGAQIYGAASKKDQAKLIYRPVREMIRHNPFFESQVKEHKNDKRIFMRGDETHFFKLLTADATSEHGLNSHVFVLDELHAQKDRELYDALDTSTVSREQPLSFLTTTADYFRESLCNDKLNYARDVRDGIINDPSFLPCIFEASVKEDWHDPAVWKRVNPNYGKSLNVEGFEKQYKKACNDSTFENTFKRLHLNIQTEQLDRWLPMDHWKLCDTKFDMEELIGGICYGGLDISSVEDITSYTLYFPSLGALLPFFWIPELNIGKFEKYREWVKQGFLLTTPGNNIDKDIIRDKILETWDTYAIESIGFDPWQAQHLAQELLGHGLEMIKFPQSFGTFTIPTKQFYKNVLSHSIRHNDNPILTWMAGNVAVKEGQNGELLPLKKQSYGKIDGMVTSIMAVGCYLSMGADEAEMDDEDILSIF